MYLKRICGMGLPGGSMVKESPANAGVIGLIPNPGRPHMLWSK